MPISQGPRWCVDGSGPRVSPDDSRLKLKPAGRGRPGQDYNRVGASADDGGPGGEVPDLAVAVLGKTLLLKRPDLTGNNRLRERRKMERC